MEKSFVKRSCDNPLCDTSITFDQQSPDLESLKNWITVVRFTVGKDQAGKPAMVPQFLNCCRSRCAANVLSIAIPNTGLEDKDTDAPDNGQPAPTPAVKPNGKKR